MTQAVLLQHIAQLQALHEKNNCVWADFFAACKDRFAKDAAFGRDYFITAFGGMFNYEEYGILPNAEDETQRLKTAEEAYNLAQELKKNDRN